MTDRASSPVVDFLQRSLVGGAVGVSELEAKARAAGLLGEQQQIRHAKSFKKAKKALGIRSIRDGFGRGGNWAWLMPPEAATEIGPVGKARPDTNEEICLSCTELPDKSAPASQGGSAVQQWIEGVQRLDCMRSPTLIPPMRWQLFLGDCHSFLSASENWAERAAALGWDAFSLFGCHRNRPLEHLGSAGLLWAINGGKLVELHRDWVVIERGNDKSRQIYHRRRRDEATIALPWAAP